VENETPDIMHAAVKAMGAVVAYYNELPTIPKDGYIDSSQVRLVWFSKTLENWKALVITTLKDSLYYEVTYSGVNQNTCVDVYKKVDSAMILDNTEVSGQQPIKYKSFEEVHGAENDPRWNVQQVPQPDPGQNWNPGAGY
jgi:hypothetical protein